MTMTRSIACLTLLAGLSLAVLCPAEEDALKGADSSVPAIDDKQIAQLIKQLDAEKADTRDAATAELRKIGAPALPILEKTLADPPSIEAKFRIQTAIDGIKLDLARQQALAIDDILAQAKSAQKEGWDKGMLERQLDALVRILAEESGNKELKLPVTFAELGKAQGAGVGIPGRGTLIKEKRSKIPHVDKSIVLCDSIADVSFARNSIIIAPVGVCTSHCENCLIITGRLAVANNATNSVLLCNSRVETSFARGSILAGPEEVTVSHAESTVFVNSKPPMPRFAGEDPRMTNKAVEVNGIKFGEKAPQDPLDGKLILTLATQQDQALALFKLPDGSGEYVARYEQEIKTPQGQPIESLQGWKLIYAGNRLAVFANGDEIACVRLGM
jgi:hypothetical protein